MRPNARIASMVTALVARDGSISGSSTGTAEASRSAPRPLMAKALVYARFYGGKDQQCRQRPLVFDALQRIGDRPPLHARLPIGCKHRRRKCVEVLQPCQCVHTQPERVRCRIDLGPSIVRRDGRRRGGVRCHHLSDHGRGSRVVQQPKCLGRTSCHQRHRIGHRGPQRLDGRWIADQTERERRHLPHFGIGVCLQERARAARRPQAVPRGQPRSPLYGEPVPRYRRAAESNPEAAAEPEEPRACLPQPAAAARSARPHRGASADLPGGSSTTSSSRTAQPLEAAAGHSRTRWRTPAAGRVMCVGVCNATWKGLEPP